MKQYYNAQFERLVEHEPELLQLEHECRILGQWYRDSKNACGNAMWYGWGPFRGIRPRMVKLVGYEAPKSRPAFMRGREAYDIARGYLYYLLPDCQHEGWTCLNFGRAPRAPKLEGEIILVRADKI